jgi:hypothetical protein
VIFPGESQRCAACGKMFTWLTDVRTRKVAAVDNDLRFGGDVERDDEAAEYERVIGHPAVERYALHGMTCS